VNCQSGALYLDALTGLGGLPALAGFRLRTVPDRLQGLTDQCRMGHREIRGRHEPGLELTEHLLMLQAEVQGLQGGPSGVLTLPQPVIPFRLHQCGCGLQDRELQRVAGLPGLLSEPVRLLRRVFEVQARQRDLRPAGFQLRAKFSQPRHEFVGLGPQRDRLNRRVVRAQVQELQAIDQLVGRPVPGTVHVDGPNQESFRFR